MPTDDMAKIDAEHKEIGNLGKATDINYAIGVLHEQVELLRSFVRDAMDKLNHKRTSQKHQALLMKLITETTTKIGALMNKLMDCIEIRDGFKQNKAAPAPPKEKPRPRVQSFPPGHQIRPVEPPAPMVEIPPPADLKEGNA